MSNLVSIVIPMFNASSYIAKTLDSIVNQTHKDIEIIVVDDCSTDDSFNVVKEYFDKNDVKSTLLKNENNSGPSHSRNRGIDVAKGEYLLFIDSDDLVVPFYVEHLINGLEDYDVAFSRMFECGEDVDLDSFSSDFDVEAFKYNCRADIIRIHGYSCGVIFKTDIIKQNNIHFCEDCRYMEDNILNLEYFKHIKSVGYVKSAVYCYVKYSGSLTHPKYKIILINKTKTADVVFENNSNVEEILKTSEECTEFIQSRRYFINCMFGEIKSSKYGYDVADQKKIYDVALYRKMIKKSNLSLVKKVQELVMLVPFIEKIVYKILL